MALTWKVVEDSRSYLGPSNQLVVAIATPAAADYPAGGYPVNAGSFGLSEVNFGIRAMWSVGATAACVGYSWQYNYTTKKLQAFQQSAATGAFTEVPAGTNFAGGTVRWMANGY